MGVLTPPTKPAPVDLGILQDVVNSSDIVAQADEWEDLDGLRRWLELRGIGSASVNGAGHRRAVRFREALRALLAANNGARGDEDARRIVAEESAALSLTADLSDQQRPALVAHGEGVEALLGRVVAALYTAQADGRWPRMKACANSECRYAFWDATKNRSGRWCTMRLCGSQSASRAYRKRQRRADRHSREA